MNLAVKPIQMKLLLGAASVLALELRAVLYTAGVDHKGLLIEGYWASTALWILTAAVVIGLLLWCPKLTGSKQHSTAFPGSLFSAIGAALAGIAFLLCPIAQAPSPAIANIELVLRIVAAGSLIWISFCRLRGKMPLFLCHSAVCLYLALRLVCQYRLWSADPQIHNYAFYLGAHVALMITAYELAAFDAGFGNHRTLWCAGLLSIFLSAVSVYPNQDPFFLICSILWVWTNLSHPSTKKRIKPAKNQTTQEEQP